MGNKSTILDFFVFYAVFNQGSFSIPREKAIGNKDCGRRQGLRCQHESGDIFPPDSSDAFDEGHAKVAQGGIQCGNNNLADVSGCHDLGQIKKLTRKYFFVFIKKDHAYRHGINELRDYC